jgi:ATP-dependent Clp protease ATP-binding subunit ClpA
MSSKGNDWNFERLPRGAVSKKGQKFERFLNHRIIGQKRAMKYMRRSMEIYWANMKDPRKPIGVFLFLGPSGVGKTETVKAVAEYFFGKPNRFTFISCDKRP